MKKDFWRWHTKKVQINETEGRALFQEREVWWCALGTNIGFEQDGSSEQFTRPVIVLSKFNLDTCLVVPLTARPKKGKYYFSVGAVSGREAVAVLSQIRFVDRKRLVVKIAFISYLNLLAFVSILGGISLSFL
jgi:mRNA interferase MazF